MQKKIRIFFAIYILFVLKVIIFKYPFEQLYAIAQTWRRNVVLEGLETANFIPFKTIKMYIDYAYKLNSFENLAGNILVFVPFGILFPMLGRKQTNFWDVFLNAFAFVLEIEIFQLFSAFGAFDVDDIILNCFGAVLGYIIYRKCRECVGIYRKKNRMEEEYGNNS
ncbi:MAG: VanZ family protein [Lachnospiraceae bacterium]|nr:VanZ family protein [Lachnospiraceae bacterium]